MQEQEAESVMRILLLPIITVDVDVDVDVDLQEDPNDASSSCGREMYGRGKQKGLGFDFALVCVWGTSAIMLRCMPCYCL